MSNRFIKFIPSEASLQFAIKYKNAFILLLVIAQSARRKNGHSDGLTIGQCHLGNHKNYGMTEKEYRYAKKILIEQGLIKIIVTNRTRKKAKQTKKLFETTFGATDGATEPTTTGTLVELCNSEVWDINCEDLNQQKGDRKGDLGATEGRLKGDKQERKEREERIRINTNTEDYAQTAARLRAKDALSFDFQNWTFIGINDIDLENWKVMYPHIDVSVEILKASQWLKNNPSKSGKKLWRKFLTGWLGRANDATENKKAFRTASGGNNQDRRTKDIHGNPVESPHTGRF